MKPRKCSICGSNLIKVIGSNVSCINKECDNYINDEYDFIYVDYHDYKDIEDFDFTAIPENLESDYEEEYDEFLFFSERKDYITRFEYRKMNNFIEDHLFKSNKIKNFKRFLDEDEIKSFNKVEKKYEIIDKGRELEIKNHKEALKYYESYLHDNLFDEDYYIYKKLVKLEKDYHKQLDLIISFFNADIYCNRYHYLWFLKKLKILSKKIDISDDVIDDCLSSFRNKGFNRKKYEDSKVPIAEKITLTGGVLKVRTNCEYSLRQFKYELKEESSNLDYVNQIRYSLQILENLILNHGFKPVRFFESICNHYHKLGEYENELKWIYGYFNKTKRYNNKNDWKFYNRLNNLNIETNEFIHDELFFDNNPYYLTKNDFKENIVSQYNLLDYISLIKEKYSMIDKAKKLEKTNPLQAIDYYESILNHELFKHDYYVYKSLFILYSQENFLKKSLDIIISFFNSGIYCDRYNYLFFLFNLKKLSQDFTVEDKEIDECLKSFKENSLNNKFLENTPAPLSERLIFHNDELKIIPGEEFDAQQEFSALDLESELYDSCSMFNSANKIFEIMIKEYGIREVELYEHVCLNYHELNDIENEKRIINEYLNNENIWNFQDKKWFEDRLSQLENMNNNQKPLKEPDFEIFFENNENYLTHDDFMINKNEFTELVDKTLLKLKLRRKGWRLGYNDYQKAIEFYKSLLDCDIFKDDYYVYRKLVLLYVEINEFELVWQTIKSFFYSGIYCNRYQYLWFLHKVANVSRVRYISEEEITDCLKFFKENGFRNKNLERQNIILAERLYHFRSSLKINKAEVYNKTQKKYELKEEAGQLEYNGVGEESIEILRNLVDNGCNKSYKTYMRLCYRYREQEDYENELEVINKYLSNKRNIYSRDWFERRLKEVNDIKSNNN